ncbi:MAG: hypothetical protein KC978_05430 [Candidatus Omnitrophica bacterium]|nr:hypothetical protein [Candidatus Omnitrophota bacterium]
MRYQGFTSIHGIVAVVASIGCYHQPVGSYPFAIDSMLRLPSINSGDARLGSSIDVDGGRVLIGAPRDDITGPLRGRAYLFDIETSLLIQTFEDPSHDLLVYFGTSVAIDGDRVLIGNPGGSVFEPKSGRAVLFDASTGEALFLFQDPTPTGNDNFGYAVALNGNRALIGDRKDNTMGPLVGQAHLFSATNGDLLHTFNDPTPTEGDIFGGAVAIEGNRILIGAPEDDTNGKGVGQAHLFDANTYESLWTFDDPTPTVFDEYGVNDLFGCSVAIKGDRVLIGAKQDHSIERTTGQAHLFDASSGALLRTFSDPTPAGGGFFGTSVDLEGDIVLVGEPHHSNGQVQVGGFSSNSEEGQTHLFDLKTGEHLQTLEALPKNPLDHFGASVAIQDGWIGVGSPNSDHPVENAGLVTLFRPVVFSSVEPESWNLYE